MSRKLKDMLKTKVDIFSMHPDATVYEVIVQMCERNIGAMLLLEDGNLAGIFTERDYARKLVIKGLSSKDTVVRDIMTSNLITVTPECTIDDCMNIMSEKRIRHLPVLDENKKVVGIISIGDIVRRVIEEQKATIEQLEHYIQG